MSDKEQENDRELTPLERYLAKQRGSTPLPPQSQAPAAPSFTTDAIYSAVPHEPRSEAAPAREPGSPETKETVKAAIGTKPGGFASRLLAYLIDSFLVWGLTASVYRIFGGLFDLLTFYTFGGGMFLSLQIVTFLYYGWFYTEKGATPGKMAVGLQIRQNDFAGRIGYVRAYFRESIGKYLSWLPLGFGFILPLFNRENRALHDLIFDTRIVETPKKQ